MANVCKPKELVPSDMKYLYKLRELLPGSAWWVVTHARRQASRGRKPSEPYKGVRNPQLALKAALRDILASDQPFDPANKYTRQQAEKEAQELLAQAAILESQGLPNQARLNRFDASRINRRVGALKIRLREVCACNPKYPTGCCG